MTDLEDLDAVVAVRSAGRTFSVRGSTDDYACALCGEGVTLAPDSLALLARRRDLPIWCVPCFIVEAEPAGASFVVPKQPG